MNEQTEHDSYSLPLIDSMVQKQQKRQIFTVLDLKHGYHQMLLHPDSRPCTAMSTPLGPMQWKVVPLGAKNGNAAFKRMMEDLLGPVRECANPLVDNIIIGSGTENMTEDELIDAHEKDLRRVLSELDKHNMVCKPTKASLFVKEVEFAGHVVGHGQRRPMPGKLASLHHWEKPQTISELRCFMGFCNYYSGYVRMYAELSGPLHKMLQVGKFDGRKGSKKKLACTPDAEDAFSRLKERLLGQLGLFLVDPDKGFVLRTDASDYAVGVVLEQIRDDGSHVPVAFWSRILAEGQRRTWTAREKETYAIVCALRKWSGHIGLQPVVVCTDHQSLQSWHKEHVDTPSGPAAKRARWHETFAKFDLSVLYVPGKDSTVADCLSRWAYPAGKAWMDISSHWDAEETEEAKRIIEMEKAMEQEEVKCFVVMANSTDLAKFRGARVQAIREEALEQWMVAPVELVRSVLTEDQSDDYAASEHWSKYWNAVSALSDDEWPEGLTEDGDKLFLKDKLLVPENRVEELIDHWHNAQLMHPGRDKMQQDLEWRFKFPPGYYAILDKYSSDCAVCRATKSANQSTAGNPVYTAIPEAPMLSVAMDVFAMPEVTVEGETYDFVILAVDRHSGYIVAVPGKKSKKKDKKDKHGVGLQAKTVANAMIRHWLTIFDVPAVICSDRGSQFVGTWFKTMCKHMGIRQAKTVAYHSRSNGRAEVAGRQMFEKFRKLHIDEPGRNWYNSLWRVLQAYHDLPGPTGLLPHRILFLRDRVSRTLPWLNHGKVARDANAMMAEADDTAAKVCKALQDEHDKRAKYFKQGKVQKYSLQDTVWVERHHKDVLSRHRQASWYVPGVIVGKVGQDVYAVRVGDNKILDRDHTQLRPRAPDPSGRPVTFEITAGDVDSDDEGEDDDFTAEKILADRPDPGTPGGRLYKVRWKRFTGSRDSWEPPSSFVPRYTTVWMDYLKKKIFLSMSRTCWSIWLLLWHRNGSPLAFCLFLCLGCLAIYPLHSISTYIFHCGILIQVDRRRFSIFDPLGPCCRSRGDRIWRKALIISVLTPPLGHGGRLRRVWGLHVSLGHGGGVGAHWGPPVLSSMTSER